MFCGICASRLEDDSLLDPNHRGYACANAHRYYHTIDEQFGGIPTADTVKSLPDDTPDLDILRFWVTDPHSRKRLPNQLALVCRRLIEIIEDGRHVARNDGPFSFCPLCAQVLEHVDSDDVYMQCLRCGNGHEFWERGGWLSFAQQGVRNHLSADLNDEYLPMLVEYWVGDSKWIQPYVHPQLRTAISKLAETLELH